MPTSLLEGNSLLVVDVGATTTRAAYFDVVEGVYRFIAAGQAPSTAESPYRDIGLGVREAIESVQAVTGKSFIDADRRLVMPSQPDGSGVDSFAATLSAGPSIRTAIVGLLSDVSMESARRLAESTYSRIVERVDLSDRRRADEQIDALLRARPDIVILSGGTDGGAARSALKMLDTIGLACFLMPAEKRPAFLFAGNASLSDDVKGLMEGLTTSLHLSHNVRPSLEVEDLDPAMKDLAEANIAIRRKQINGVEELEGWSHGHILPTSFAAARMIRFLGSGAMGGALGVNLGGASASIAAGFASGGLSLKTYPQFGLGENLAALLQNSKLEDFTRWLSLDIHEGALRDAIYQKSLYPTTIPATPEDRVIAQAIARQALHLAVRAARKDFPASARAPRHDLMPYFEMIIASGAALSDGGTPGQNLLLLLDAIQPVGIAQIMLDRNNLLPMLGVAAEINNLLPVQALESGAFQNLGTTVSVVSGASYGTPILQARLKYGDRNETRLEVKQGALEAIPLGVGQAAQLSLQPLHRADIGFGPGRSHTTSIHGGALGVVIDARGRSLQLPSDAVRRRELFKKWLWTLGG
ncbi:MAG: glutamate mutase L [Chloroflexi bacterium]|nr:glutamate mutase L [Chloroflexota bacterium]